MVDINLPPLPEGLVLLGNSALFIGGRPANVHSAYTAEQMHAYARAAIEQERERVLAIVEEKRPYNEESVNWTDCMFGLDSTLSEVIEDIRGLDL